MNEENVFGVYPITPIQNEIIKKIMNKFSSEETKYEDGDPVYFKQINLEGILTDKQWMMVDAFSSSNRPTMLEVMNALDNKSMSSIQSPRDNARKKIIEAIITVALVLEDENILKYFIGDVL